MKESKTIEESTEDCHQMVILTDALSVLQALGNAETSSFPGNYIRYARRESILAVDTRTLWGSRE